MNFAEVSQELLNGFLVTILLFLVTFILSIFVGILFCRIRMSKNKFISKLFQIFIWIIRGTPLMLQIIVIFYVPGLLFNIKGFNRYAAVIIALTINYSVYYGEIFRSGYESIDKGQFDASYNLGLSKREIFFKVVLLQVVKKVLPPFTNETISLVKDTALARVISVTEIIFAAQKITATYALIYVLFYTGVFYLAFNGLLSLLFNKLENKLKFVGA
jgi:polar amino acid transport system permease protein